MKEERFSIWTPSPAPTHSAPHPTHLAAAALAPAFMTHTALCRPSGPLPEGSVDNEGPAEELQTPWGTAHRRQEACCQAWALSPRRLTGCQRGELGPSTPGRGAIQGSTAFQLLGRKRSDSLITTYVTHLYILRRLGWWRIFGRPANY